MKFDLVFEGGGAKGMAFVGALDEFARRGHSFGRLLGTSAGAIIAVLLAAGYTPAELLGVLDEQKNGTSIFASFLGPPEPFTSEQVRTSEIRNLLRDVNLRILPDFLEDRLDDELATILAENARTRAFFALVERGGWYGAENFRAWLQTKLDSGRWRQGERAFSQMTLAQFFAETEVDLSVVASDTTDGRLLVLNHRTAPECPIVWAVRMSMNIPFVWDEVVWNVNWGTYMNREMTGHTVVDGGLLSNFPLELFVSIEPQITKVMGPKHDSAPLGLLIDESLPVPPMAQARGLLVDIHVKPEELRSVLRIRRLVDTAISAHDKMVIEEFDHLVVRLPAAGYGTTEFDMSIDRRNTIVAAGRAAMRAYFDHAPTATRGSAKGVRDESMSRKADRLAMRILFGSGVQ